MIKNCLVCKIAFKTKPSKNGIYCSKKCYGITLKNRESSGENNANWKGGRYIDKEGYVMRYSPNHPFKSHQNYVKEHRLVVEEHLKRFLKPNEIVHHKNGIVDDNRIENLEVMSPAKHAICHKRKPCIEDCQWCKKEFRYGKKKQKFCSPTCQANAIRTSIEKTCKNCGKKFFTQPHRLLSGRGNFCSRDCGYHSILHKKINTEMC